MLSMEIDVLPVEDIDLEHTPPCELHQAGPEPSPLCGQPSVARLRLACVRCTDDECSFVCARCLLYIRTGHVNCMLCHRSDYLWTEI